MKLEVSKLMDHYTDTEFCPKERYDVSADAVQTRVMAQAAAHRKKRWAAKLALTAAAAAACVGMIAAGLPAQVYHMVTGGILSSAPDSDHIDLELPSADTEGSPVSLEEGRLYLTLDGQRTDITDLIDENTPYIRTRTDPDTGAVGHIIVGGTPEDYGYAEFVQTDDGSQVILGWNYGNQILDVNPGSAGPSEPQGDEQYAAGSYRFIEKPWFSAAKAQLNIEN